MIWNIVRRISAGGEHARDPVPSRLCWPVVHRATFSEESKLIAKSAGLLIWQTLWITSRDVEEGGTSLVGHWRCRRRIHNICNVCRQASHGASHRGAKTVTHHHQASSQCH